MVTPCYYTKTHFTINLSFLITYTLVIEHYQCPTAYAYIRVSFKQSHYLCSVI